ncbi:MAG: hypothetical protein AAGN46_04290, partial [Acidobacteriota bacterium]
SHETNHLILEPTKRQQAGYHPECLVASRPVFEPSFLAHLDSHWIDHDIRGGIQPAGALLVPI